MSWLLDTNILLRLFESPNKLSDVASHAVKVLADRNSRDLHITSQNLGEFWNVSTRPTGANGVGLTPAQASYRLSELETAFTLLPDTPECHQVWMALLRKYEVRGSQVHDARLAAMMIVYKIPRVLTFDFDDLVRFREIDCYHPNDISL